MAEPAKLRPLAGSFDSATVTRGKSGALKYSITQSRKDFEASFYQAQQTEAKDWIEKLLEIQIPEDFQLALRDGVILCKILERIGSQIKFNPAPRAAASSIENIQSFLNECQKLKIQTTFSSLDLHEQRNFKRVVSCIHEVGAYFTKLGHQPAFHSPSSVMSHLQHGKELGSPKSNLAPPSSHRVKSPRTLPKPSSLPLQDDSTDSGEQENLTPDPSEEKSRETERFVSNQKSIDSSLDESVIIPVPSENSLIESSTLIPESEQDSSSSSDQLEPQTLQTSQEPSQEPSPSLERNFEEPPKLTQEIQVTTYLNHEFPREFIESPLEFLNSEPEPEPENVDPEPEPKSDSDSKKIEPVKNLEVIEKQTPLAGSESKRGAGFTQDDSSVNSQERKSLGEKPKFVQAASAFITRPAHPSLVNSRKILGSVHRLVVPDLRNQAQSLSDESTDDEYDEIPDVNDYLISTPPVLVSSLLLDKILQDEQHSSSSDFDPNPDSPVEIKPSVPLPSKSIEDSPKLSSSSPERVSSNPVESDLSASETPRLSFQDLKRTVEGSIRLGISKDLPKDSVIPDKLDSINSTLNSSLNSNSSPGSSPGSNVLPLDSHRSSLSGNSPLTSQDSILKKEETPEEEFQFVESDSVMVSGDRWNLLLMKYMELKVHFNDLQAAHQALSEKSRDDERDSGSRIRIREKKSSTPTQDKKSKRVQKENELAKIREEQIVEQQRQKEIRERNRKNQQEARQAGLTDKQQKQRMSVLQEILDTEKDYVHSLEKLMQTKILLEDERIISFQESILIFANIEQLQGIHLEIASSLDMKLLSSSDDQCWNSSIGEIFLKSADFLKLYTIYVGNQQNQADALETCSHRKAFMAGLSKAFPQLDKALVLVELHSDLIKPIQRICKYPLLLRELLNCTPDSHEDRANLEKAYTLLQGITMFINEKKKESENYVKLVSINQTLTDLPRNFKLVSPDRVFLMDGSLVKISKGRAQERQFWLFNDLLIWGARQVLKSKFQFKGKVQLNQILVNDLADSETLQNAFELVRVDHKKKKYIICTKEPHEKITWMNQISARVYALLEAERDDAGKPSLDAVSQIREACHQIEVLEGEIDSLPPDLRHVNYEKIAILKKQVSQLKRDLGTDTESQILVHAHIPDDAALSFRSS